MTRTEMVNRLEELKAKAEGLAMDYNAAMLDNKFDEASKIDDELTAAVGEYTANARILCFEDLSKCENPMISAVTQLTYDGLAVKDNKVEGAKIPTRTVEIRPRPIDLRKLHKHCDGIGADAKWIAYAEKYNFLLTLQKCNDLGVPVKEVNDSYLMSSLAKEIDMGKTPTSNTNMLKTLQTVITAMLGEGYKATSHDVKYLTTIYCKKSRKALQVKCSNHASFTSYLAEVCHRVVTNAPYEVVYKKVTAK